MSDRIDHYLEKLGAKPDATIDEINTAYFGLLQQFSEVQTEEQANEMRELQHAYAIVRRHYTGPEPKKSIKIDPGAWTPFIGALLLVTVLTFAILNFSSIELMITQYEPGDVVRWEHEQTPYGEILSYDPNHRFHTGEAAAAYEIRLAGTGEVVWLSHRIVVKGMTEMDAQEIQAAAVNE